jgi:hypothetical protein
MDVLEATLSTMRLSTGQGLASCQYLAEPTMVFGRPRRPFTGHNVDFYYHFVNYGVRAAMSTMRPSIGQILASSDVAIDQGMVLLKSYFHRSGHEFFECLNCSRDGFEGNLVRHPPGHRSSSGFSECLT